jgi:hypothetical protein
LFSFVLSAFSCHNSTNDNLPDCDCEGRTYKIFNNVRGIVDYKSSKDVFKIVIDGMPFVPCNFDIVENSFLKDSLQVVCSGEVKGICANVRYSGNPMLFTKIELVNK